MKIAPEIIEEFFMATGQQYGSEKEIFNWYFNNKGESMSKTKSEMENEISEFDNVINKIQQDRMSDYGDAEVSFDNIAQFWSAYMQRRFRMIQLDKVDVANMLELMKMSRFAYIRKHDSALDKAAYADFALKFTEQ